jgi:putative tryptophan/tyrosine transport system substrate-binding protein
MLVWALGEAMRRREFIHGLAGSTIAWPLAARAQQLAAAPTIGFLTIAVKAQMPSIDGFRRGLKEVGFVEGQNVNIEYRSAENDYDRLPSLADDLVRQHVALIFANGSTPAALAAKAATTTIPIVFAVGVDPVKYGLVASLKKPGGNITGVTFLASELATKQLEVAHLLLPDAPLIGVLVNPKNPFAQTDTKNIQDIARLLKKEILVLKVDADRDFDAAFATFVQQGARVLVVPGDTLFYNRRERLVALAARYALPTVYAQREFVDSGGLMSYGANIVEANRLAAGYVGRILKGEKASDLPAQEVTKLEFVINLKTAKALGVAVPLPLLGRVDEVIE